MSIYNSIITANDSDVVFIQDSATSLIVSYSNIEGGWLGEGNIDANPLFCEPDSNNYHLSENSPSAGTGEDGAELGAFAVGCGTLEIELSSILYTSDVPHDWGSWGYI